MATSYLQSRNAYRATPGGAAAVVPLPIASGGTGATTAAAAKVQLDRSVTTLTWAATVNTDCAVNTCFEVTLAGATTLANPTNVAVGATYTWLVIQDGTGGRSLTLGNSFKLPDGFTFQATAAANGYDLLSAYAKSATDLLLSFGKKYG